MAIPRDRNGAFEPVIVNRVNPCPKLRSLKTALIMG
ncbi:MAG: hypothetical protein NT070_11475 [Cyanobacteria bacterium]|nr:hypothetical protein [Cyanobacteriota bacterium]